MKRKLIFVDVDGTLTIPGTNIIPDSALSAIEKARKNGHMVFLCTGRNLGALQDVLQYPFDGYVASAGGYVSCKGKVIYDNPMQQEQFDLAMEVFARNKIFRTVECLNASYADKGIKKFLEGKDYGIENSELVRWQEQLHEALHVLPMEKYDGQPVYKIVFLCMDPEQLLEPDRLLAQKFNICTQGRSTYGCINGEIINREFDKGQGIRRICDALGGDIEDTIGFGDSMNDIEMIEKVGISVCMENGSETLKKLADRVCPSVEANGLYEGFSMSGLY